MSQAAQITLTGNLGTDPELRFTATGVPVVTINVACAERRRADDGQWVDGPISWWRVTAWRSLAENAAESLRKGDRVTVIGSVRQTSWEDRASGETKYGTEVQADEIGLSLRFAAARSRRPERANGNGGMHDTAESAQ